MSFMNIQERDLKLLKFCGEQKFMSRRQVDDWMSLFGNLDNGDSANRVSRRRLSLLRSNGFVQDIETTSQASKLWAVTSKGYALLKDQGLIPDYVGSSHLDLVTANHDQWITEVRLSAHRQNLAWDWFPESYLKPLSSDKVPDAVVDFHSPKKGLIKIAIEVELTLKSKSRLESIFSNYQESDYGLILYFSKDQRLQDQLLQVASQVCPKAYFCHVSDFCGASKEVLFVNQNDSFHINQFKGDHHVS